LDVLYKTAFVLSHKIREATASQTSQTLSGEVEVDGDYFGGHVKPTNRKSERPDRHLKVNQSGKRQSVIVMRERDGYPITIAAPSEAVGVAQAAWTVLPGSTVYADQASHWDALEAHFLTKRINHSEAYSTADACTNMAESFFSRIRRAEIGIHHHIAGPYLNASAAEM
jgi:hypothetical protein